MARCSCGKVGPLLDNPAKRVAGSKTKRCGLCSGYVVPGFHGRQLRRSERLRGKLGRNGQLGKGMLNRDHKRRPPLEQQIPAQD